MSDRALSWHERTPGKCREHGMTLVPACSECFTSAQERVDKLYKTVVTLKATLVLALEVIDPDACECFWSAGMLEEQCVQCRIESAIREALTRTTA